MRNYASLYPNRHHTIPTMMHLQAASEELFAALPAEFSKSEFNAIRSQLGNRGLSYASARKYGIIVVVREEPCKRLMTCEFWTNPVTGEKYTYEEYMELSKKKGFKEEKTDLSTARFYIKEGKRDAAKAIYDRFDSPVLHTVLACVLLVALYSCMFFCMPGILNLVNSIFS